MPVRGTQETESLRGDPNVDLSATPIAGWRGLVLNNKRKPLDDAPCGRGHIHQPSHRQSLLNDVLQIFGTLDGCSPIPPRLTTTECAQVRLQWRPLAAVDRSRCHQRSTATDLPAVGR